MGILIPYNQWLDTYRATGTWALETIYSSYLVGIYVLKRNLKVVSSSILAIGNVSPKLLYWLAKIEYHWTDTSLYSQNTPSCPLGKASHAPSPSSYLRDWGTSWDEPKHPEMGETREIPALGAPPISEHLRARPVLCKALILFAYNLPSFAAQAQATTFLCGSGQLKLDC